MTGENSQKEHPGNPKKGTGKDGDEPVDPQKDTGTKNNECSGNSQKETGMNKSTKRARSDQEDGETVQLPAYQVPRTNEAQRPSNYVVLNGHTTTLVNEYAEEMPHPRGPQAQSPMLTIHVNEMGLENALEMTEFAVDQAIQSGRTVDITITTPHWPRLYGFLNPCANCGQPSHKLADCVGPPDARGYMQGCPACNTLDHFLDECDQVLNMSDRQIEDLLVARRARKPMFPLMRSFPPLAEEYPDDSRGYPLSMEYVATEWREKELWKTYDYESPGHTPLPKDPRTASIETMQRLVEVQELVLFWVDADPAHLIRGTERRIAAAVEEFRRNKLASMNAPAPPPSGEDPVPGPPNVWGHGNDIMGWGDEDPEDNAPRESRTMGDGATASMMPEERRFQRMGPPSSPSDVWGSPVERSRESSADITRSPPPPRVP
ncbi:hypothetical protein NKR23_g10622 [Pleurostoma richardsiae]|uniref:CCHC-type domain-containing protein n=1 Tax=Pleurostoma richardsiae TaxID=41990 RepID=A0AA38R488_9PEZI|nr:hypothetical protein NKR23_g10622 [Pleurostoma richardsiae]